MREQFRNMNEQIQPSEQLLQATPTAHGSSAAPQVDTADTRLTDGGRLYIADFCRRG